MPETIKREVMAWLNKEAEHADQMIARYSWLGNAKYKNLSNTRLHFEERRRIIRAAMVLIEGVPREALEPDPKLQALLLRIGQQAAPPPAPSRIDRALAAFDAIPWWIKAAIGITLWIVTVSAVAGYLGRPPA